MMLQCQGASRYLDGGMGQLRIMSLAGLGTILPQPAPSSSCRTHPWARFPSPSLVPLELHCRLSSFCILQTGTRVPGDVPCVPNTVPSAIPSCFSSLTLLCSYLMVSSVVGFYSSPLFTRLLPERQDTPLTKVGAVG